MAETERAWFEISEHRNLLAQAGLVLGVGLGGSFDGIVFHQIFQWHQLLSAHPDPSIANDVHLNMFADGLFHLGTWVLTVAGVVLLWRALRLSEGVPSGRVLGGSVLMGWGVFNLVEGIVNHVLLEIHHVWPGGPGPVVLWDALFLAWGLLFLVGGYAIVQSARVVSHPDQHPNVRK